MFSQNTNQIKEKIISFLRIRGPSIPVHIAREIGLSILFSSAFLAELVSEKKVKMSHMRIGSSPIYFLPGQEPLLERFADYLKSREKEAFLFLREKKFLKDSEVGPVVRVALRAIKDFAIPFENNKELFWRYFTVPETEFRVGKLKKEKKELQILQPISKSRKKETEVKKEKSDFVLEVLHFLKEKNIELVKEINAKKKEFLGIGYMTTSIGELKLLILAKDKKKITENDLSVGVQRGHAEKKIVLFISKGELDKKAQLFLEQYENIKFLKMNRKS